MNTIADVQSSRDLRNLPDRGIRVGIKDLRFPITLQTAAHPVHSCPSDHDGLPARRAAVVRICRALSH